MKISIIKLTALIAALGLNSNAQSFLIQSVNYSVSGMANPWLGGMPTGTVDLADTVPEQSPTQVTQSLAPGTVFTWTATGLASNGPFGSGWPYVSPDGAGHPWATSATRPNGAPVYSGSFMALIGVFLGQDPQVFFMGSSGSLTVPEGVTEFYMGVADTYEWRNNDGAFEVSMTSVSPVPEPSTYAMFAGLGLIAFAAYRRNRK